MRPFLSRAVLVASSSLLIGGAAGDHGRDMAVFEAVFRQQIHEHLDATERARGTVLCVAIIADGSARSVETALLPRLSGEPAVRPGAACEARAGGAVEVATSTPAIVVTAGPIEWIAADEAWVSVSYYRTALLSAKRRYRVVREREGWVSLGQIIKDAPA